MKSRPAIVVMGVSGSGKSLIGKGVADAIGGTFVDADDLHPAANVAKMAAGTPLTDEDRWPWLELVAAEIAAASSPLVVACSALKKSYRDVLRRDADVLFVLLDGTFDVLFERVSSRPDHFMPASLLQSQLDTLEPLESDENALLVDVTVPRERKVAMIADRWRELGSDGMGEVANVAVVGLGVMGASLAQNLARQSGNRVAVFNRSAEKTREFIADHPDAGIVPTFSYQELADSLSRPRVAIIMVQAGAATDAVIENLVEVFEPGDVIVDGGNSRFTDTIAREAAVAGTGIEFVGVGISGGEEGALWGPSIMPGGSAQSWEALRPLLTSIAAVVDGEPCVTHVGTDGAGHFVKMVHNGIEYADMQLIAEAYDLLRVITGKSAPEIGEIFSQWNAGELDSYLIEITAEVLKQTDAHTGQPLVDVIVDQAGAKGTGAWTVEAAAELGVSASVIAEALFARSLSSAADQRLRARALQGPSGSAVPLDDEEGFIEAVRRALFASKIVAYSQGFDEIKAGAAAHGWDVDRSAVARIWRGGCIIRAQFLNQVAAIFEASPAAPLLLAEEPFVQSLVDYQQAWRDVVIRGIAAGVPTPAISAALAYFDGVRADRLPLSLVQGQRDFFGAHTYERTDRPGSFHTLWAADRREEQVDS